MTTPIGAKLRELRGKRPQVEIAAKLGISMGLLSAWENGRLIPPERRLRLLLGLVPAPEQEAMMAEFQELRATSVIQRDSNPELMVAILRDVRDLLGEIRDLLAER